MTDLEGRPLLLIVGGGFAGVAAAAAAARVRAEIEDGSGGFGITVVNPTEWLTLRPRLYETDLSHARVRLPEVLAPLEVELRIGSVDRIDPSTRQVTLDDGETIRYDRLVLAAGSRLRAPDLDGDSAVLHDVDSYESAVALQRHVEAIAGSARPVAERFSAVVVGAGLAGLETATELASALQNLAARHGHPGAQRVCLVDPAPDIAALFGDEPASALTDALATTGVEAVLGRRVVGVDRSGVSLDDGDHVPAGTVVWTAGLEPSPLVSQLSNDVDRLGRVLVDPFLRVPGRDGIYAAGDVAAATADESHLTVMSCQHAIPTGEAAGRNAAFSLMGRDAVEFRASPYVTCIDLGEAGGLFTTGWDRRPVATGAEGKKIKREVIEMIHPRVWASAARQSESDASPVGAIS